MTMATLTDDVVEAVAKAAEHKMMGPNGVFAWPLLEMDLISRGLVRVILECYQDVTREEKQCSSP